MDKLTRITFFVVLLMNLVVAGYAQDVMRDNTLNYAQELKPKFEYHVEPLTIEPHYSVELTNNSKRQRVVRATIDPSTLISDGVFRYSVLGDNSVALVGLTNILDLLSGDVVIPAEVQIDDITYHVDSVYCSLSEIVDSRGVINLDIQAPFNEIPDGLFNEAFQLQTVKFPSTLKSIGEFAFNMCSGLTGDLVLPEGLISIGKAAFQLCEGLTGELVFPKSLTSVGEYAFYGCVFSGQIPSLDKLNDIPEALFYACSGLTGELVLPEGLTSIGDAAFAHCSGLTGKLVLPDGLTYIEPGAFCCCSGFTGLVLPESLKAIGVMEEYDIINPTGGLTFSQCSGFTGELVIPKGLTAISHGDFYYCSGFTSLVLPEGLTYIADDAFRECSGFTGELELPESLTYIGIHAFSRCSGFTGDLVLPKGISSIGYAAFYRCSGFTGRLVLPEGLTSIGDLTFYECSFTGNLVLPEGLTSIGDRAFYNCSGFTGELELPESLTSIGSAAFYECSGFTGNLVLPENLKEIGVMSANEGDIFGGLTFSQCSGFTGDLILPKGLTAISHGDFSGCSGFTGLVLPEGLTSIGDVAFYECSFKGNLVLPEGLTSIGDRAFYNCSGFTGELELPESLTSIGDDAFYNCSGLSNIVVEVGNPTYDSRENCNAIIETATNKLITGCKNSFIPNSVTSIGNYAFESCSGLTSIEIPNSITSIGESAFRYCDGLTSVNIGNSVTSIGNSAFYGCSGLTSIEIPNSITSIGESTFRYCDGLTSVNIGNSVTSIGNSVFYGCSGLTSIEIPNSITSIGNSAFESCSGLTSVTIGNSVTSIGDYAFLGCYKLTSVVIGNSVTSIGESAFRYCSGLTSIEIPNSVTAIGDWAFNACSSLRSIVIGNSVTSIGNNAFNGCTSLTKITCLATNPPTISADTFSNYEAELCVPTGCKVEYESVEYWKNFTNIIELPTLATSITLDKTEVELEATQTATLVATVLPELTTNKSISWSSSNESIATVDENGVVTAIAVGEATITATTNDGTNLSATCKVTVVPTLAETITLDKTEISLEATETATLVATVLPELTTNKSVTWTSSNEAVATVDANGVVTAIALGEAVITATTTDGSDLSATCLVIVVPTLAETITLDKTEISLEATETATLVASVLPELTTNKSVTWTSSNEAVATVDANGVVTAIADGEATITATTTDGSNLQAKCKITVVDPNADQPSETNYMLIPETEAFCGTSIKLPIELVNEDEIISFQCDLYLPDGITITDVDGKYDITLNNSRNSDFMLNYNMLSDGTLRIIAISFTSTPIKGNSGELINIGLDISSDCSGEYTIEVKDIIMSDINGKEIVASDIIGSLNVIDYILGDANGDGKVNIVDASAVINYVLGKSPAKFVIKAADVNGSGSVNIADASGIINIVLGKATNNAPAVLNSNSLDDCLIAEGVDVNKLSLALVNNNQFTSFQFDLKVENNVELKNILPSVRLADSHKIFFNKISDQTYRIACVSMSNETIDGECSNLMDLIFENSDNTRIKIDNIIFSTPNAVEYLMESIAVDMPETNSIDNVYTQTDIYIKGKSVVVESPCDCVTSITSLTGVVQRMETSAGINFYNLESGFYIVSSNNITKKIIIK